MVRVGPQVDYPWNVQYRVQNYELGIALEQGESNVVDIKLAVHHWIETVVVRCNMILPKVRRGPNYVWNNRKVHDIEWRRDNGRLRRHDSLRSPSHPPPTAVRPKPGIYRLTSRW